MKDEFVQLVTVAKGEDGEYDFHYAIVIETPQAFHLQDGQRTQSAFGNETLWAKKDGWTTDHHEAIERVLLLKKAEIRNLELKLKTARKDLDELENFYADNKPAEGEE